MTRAVPIDPAVEIAQMDRIARLLDARFGVFGIRFGWDSILGLVPFVGDLAAALPSGWLIWKAFSLNMSAGVKLRMAVNWALDLVIGSIPVLGNLFDLFFKANLRNAALMRSELERMAATRA